MLLPGGFAEDSVLRIDGETIETAGSDSNGSAGSVIDARGCYVLPGLVDFHGDAFERALAPRPRTRVAGPIAFRDVDAQLVANGITTALVSPTLTWESDHKLRNDEGAARVMKEFAEARPQMRSDTLLHLRFEIHHAAGEKTVAEWLSSGAVDLLAFNDHLNYFRDRLAASSPSTSRATGIGDSLESTLASLEARRSEAHAGVERLAAIARELHIPMCAHDEESEEQRRWYHRLGSRISEFPINSETMQAARELGDDVVLGAPNLVKGASMYNRISSREAVKSGACTILASDYYYPALLHAPFLSEQLELCSLEQAWPLVSANPARALGLNGRGVLAPGKRADVVVVERYADGTHGVVATIAAGRIVYLANTDRVRTDSIVAAD